MMGLAKSIAFRGDSGKSAMKGRIPSCFDAHNNERPEFITSSHKDEGDEGAGVLNLITFCLNTSDKDKRPDFINFLFVSVFQVVSSLFSVSLSCSSLFFPSLMPSPFLSFFPHFPRGTREWHSGWATRWSIELGVRRRVAAKRSELNSWIMQHWMERWMPLTGLDQRLENNFKKLSRHAIMLKFHFINRSNVTIHSWINQPVELDYYIERSRSLNDWFTHSPKQFTTFPPTNKPILGCSIEYWV